MFSFLFFLKRKVVPGFHIKKRDLVVDIGSGDKPFWRADVFLDTLSLGNNQRISNSETIHDLGLFFDGDVANMPFADNVFDFSFCSHLLEHVEDPAVAIKEIMRVSKSGYIEIPNALIEFIRPFHSHLWFIYNIDGQLIFVRKSKIMHNICVKNGKRYHYLNKKINNPFIRFYWKDKIDYKIINDLSEDEFFVVDSANEGNKTAVHNNLYIIFVKILRYLFYKKKEIIKNYLVKSNF